MVAKVADPAADVQYANMYGTGLVELHKYKEPLGPLNEAITRAHTQRELVTIMFDSCIASAVISTHM